VKIKLYLLTFFISTSAHANLIDLTPGGTVIDYGPPSYIAAHGFYDEAAFGTFDLPGGPTFIKGWVSQFGILNGGQYFFTDLFTHPHGPTAHVSWNFGNSGYWLQYIDVVGFDESGNSLANLYQVPWGSRLTDEDIVTLNGQMIIKGIAFYGRNPALPIPESGGTFSLLLFAFLCLAACYAMKCVRRQTVHQFVQLG
jgi:hypothetical protein